MRMRILGLAGVLAAATVVFAGGPPQIGIRPTERITSQPPQPLAPGERLTIGIGPLAVPTATATGTASAPATAASAPAAVLDRRLTVQRAQTIVRAMALESPNPYVRETVYHDRDADWTINLPALTFAVKIRGAEEKVYTGKLTPTGNGWAKAAFDEEAALWRGWTVPADAVLTAEAAERCLAEMCGRMADESVMQSLGEAMKGAALTAEPATGEWTASASREGEYFNWHINLRERIFTVDEGAGDVMQSFTGRFGWDKERHWTAWPIVGVMTVGGARAQRTEYLVIPDGQGGTQAG
jgi:hypothetical protein